jgi:hypothetical protein
MKRTFFSLILVATLICFGLGCGSKESSLSESKPTPPEGPVAKPTPDHPAPEIANESETEPQLNPAVTVKLKWTSTDGAQKEKVVIESLPPAEINDYCVWLLFQEQEGKLIPVIAYNGSVHSLGTPATDMQALSLAVEYTDSRNERSLERLLFGENRVLGTRNAHKDNIYCLTILPDVPIDPSSLLQEGIPGLDRARALRPAVLNLRYAKESDAFSRETGKVFEVKTHYELPRVLIAAEEWIELPAKKKEKPDSSSGGLFGVDLDEEIFGSEKPTPEWAPTYSVDVLLDEIEAQGTYPEAFQTARSLSNDVLEGKIIYQATGAKRRVLTASTVFYQMTKNRLEKGIENEAVVVSQTDPSSLESCPHLWPQAKKEILSFLGANPGWKVLVPRQPVVFFAGDNPAYGMYAWLQIDPASGRMIGVLPTGLHGASEEWAAVSEILGKEALSQMKSQVEKTIGSEGGLHGFLSTVAGMYVSSAGILDGVGITMVNSEVDALSDEEWKKFLANHALKFARQFLEDHADIYDSYSSRMGFWAGVAAMTSHFDGEEAARKCLGNAWNDCKEKAINDAKKWIEDKVGKVKGAARNAVVNEAAERFGDKAKQAKELFNKAHKAYTGVTDAIPDAAADIAPHLKNIIKEA